MATDTSVLQGEVNDDPESQELEVEKLLAGFLSALIEEQKQLVPLSAAISGLTLLAFAIVSMLLLRRTPNP